jgi:hypothetical protein
MYIKISFSSNFWSHLAFLGGELVNWMVVIMRFYLWINHHEESHESFLNCQEMILLNECIPFYNPLKFANRLI